MIVLDASAAIDWLLQTTAGQAIESRIYSRNQSLHAPHVIDLEVGQVLRRLVHEATVSVQRADQAIQDLLDLRLSAIPTLFCCRGSGSFGIIFRRTTLHTSLLPKNSTQH